MAIAEKLTYLNETKKQIKSALQSKGVSVSDSDTFRSYAEKISNLQIGGLSKLPQVADKSITELTADDLDGATSVKANVFTNCTNLTSIELADSVTSVETGAFTGCTNIESFDTGNGLSDLSTITFTDYANLKNVVIGDGVTSLPEKKFEGCTSLISVQLSDNIGTMGNEVFDGCTNLTTVKLPKNITRIPFLAFSNCTNLTNITLPDNLTEMGGASFSGCLSLTSITIPEKITTLGASEFKNCNNLIEINYCSTNCDDLKYNYQAFTSLVTNGTTFNVASNVIKIPANLMGGDYGNCNVTNIIFANNSQCTSIGSNAFKLCSQLVSIKGLPPTPPVLGNSNSIPTNVQRIEVPSASLDAYKTATNWSQYASIMVGV